MRPPLTPWTLLGPLPSFSRSQCPTANPCTSKRHFERPAGIRTTIPRLTTAHKLNTSADGFAQVVDPSLLVETDSMSLPRLDVAEIVPSQVRDMLNLSKPFILTGVIPGQECEDWCEALMTDLADSDVDFQIRNNEDGRSELFRASLSDFVRGLQEESTHDESWYVLDEHLLNLPEVRPELARTLRVPQDVLGEDEFELFFPPAVRPQKHCAIIGGVGARSFLHSDPMEWMGWNVLLEGRKLWTFLPPLSELDTALETYRLTSNAFGSHNISAGWQSNVDLYRSGPPSFDERNRVCWPAAGEGLAEVLQHAVSGVQLEGELVVIPPRYWHQVYHLEPSVAVASQYMDKRVRGRVFRHILNWCGTGEEALPKQFDSLNPAEQVLEVLKTALVARFGQAKGLEVFETLDHAPP